MRQLSTSIKHKYPQDEKFFVDKGFCQKEKYKMLIIISNPFNRYSGRQENTEKMQVLLDLAGFFVIIENDVFQNRGGGFNA